jgi:hypothetical protein
MDGYDEWYVLCSYPHFCPSVDLLLPLFFLRCCWTFVNAQASSLLFPYVFAVSPSPPLFCFCSCMVFLHLKKEICGMGEVVKKR